MHRQIKRINLIQQRCDIVNNLELNVGRALRFAKFPAQTFSRAVAQVAEVVLEISEVEAEPRHWHARNSDKTIARKEGEGLAVSRRKILEHDERCLRRPGDYGQRLMERLSNPGRIR